jgi:hypothetical protein
MRSMLPMQEDIHHVLEANCGAEKGGVGIAAAGKGGGAEKTWSVTRECLVVV